MARRGSSAGILVSQEVGVRQQAIVALQVDGYSFALVGVAQANVRRVKAVLKNGQNNREITLTRLSHLGLVGAVIPIYLFNFCMQIVGVTKCRGANV